MMNEATWDNVWELSYCDEALEAERQIEAAWDYAINNVPTNIPKEAQVCLVWDHVGRIMDEWSDVGATDSEPFNVLVDRIIDHFGKEVAETVSHLRHPSWLGEWFERFYFTDKSTLPWRTYSLKNNLRGG